MKNRIIVKKIVDPKRLHKLFNQPGVCSNLGIEGIRFYHEDKMIFEFGAWCEEEAAEFVLDAAEHQWKISYFPALDQQREAFLGNLLGFYLNQGLKSFSLARETLNTYKEIHSIFQMAESISKARFLAEVSERVLESFKSSLDCPWVSLWIFKRKKNEKEFRVVKYQEIIQNSPPYDETEQQRLLEHLLNEKYKADIFAPPTPDFFPESVVDSGHSFFIPLRTAERRLGGIFAVGQPGREYDAGDLKLATSLGIQASFSLQNALLFEEIESLFDGVVRSMIAAIDSRDSTTSGHSARISMISERFAEAINQTKFGKYAEFEFSRQELRELRYSGLLHDIGKIGVREDVLKKRNRLHPAEMEAIMSRFDFICLREAIDMEKERECVLRANRAYNLLEEDLRLLTALRERTFEDIRGERKPFLSDHEYEALSLSHGNLTESEVQEMRKHPLETYKILSKIHFSSDLKNIPRIASEHHEKIDGSGYPWGLQGDEIMLQSQIMGIADIYEALVDKKRPYKPGFSREEALSIIEKEVQEKKIDPVLFEIFKSNLDEIVGKSS